MKESGIFTKIESITKSIEARFKNYSVNVNEIDWKCPENSVIKEIRYAAKCYRSADFVLPEKTAKRGRKPLIKKESDPISDISFIVRKSSHRTRRVDSYSKTSIVCIEHIDCEIVFKNYTVLIFGKGRIVCVGIVEENCEDFIWCTSEVQKYLISNGLNADDLEIVDINKTLENFKFELLDKERRIDLYKLNNLFVSKMKNGEILNVDLNEVYQYIIDKMDNEDFNFNPGSIADTFNKTFEIKYYLITRLDFIDFLKKLEIEQWYYTISKYYEGFFERNSNRLTAEINDRIKDMLIRGFVINKTLALISECTVSGHNVVESINIIDEKNTAVMVKRVKGKCVTVKLFTTGKIDILGSKTIDQVHGIYKDLEILFTENPDLIYHLDDW